MHPGLDRLVARRVAATPTVYRNIVGKAAVCDDPGGEHLVPLLATAQHGSSPTIAEVEHESGSLVRVVEKM